MEKPLMIKYSNLIFFIVASVLFVTLFPREKITQEVLDLFPKTSDREIIDIYREFSGSHYVAVAHKGFDADSKHNLEAFLARIASLPNVEATSTYTKAPQALQDFITKHYIAIATPRADISLLSPQEIKNHLLTGLQNLQIPSITQTSNIAQKPNTSINSQVPNPDSPILNPNDPLGAFFLPPHNTQELIAKGYGYVGLVELKSLEDKDIKESIKGFEAIAKDFPNIRYFSQNFMDSINLDLILREVSFLLTFASVVFALLYFIIIRIPMLTLNTIATLVGANIVAMFVVQAVYPKVTIMALSFGMGISNIAIDYMMHHNFFNLYTPKNSGFNRPVFYGYLTTIIGFATCLFIPFPLLAQLSLYAIVSLSISYCFFAFLYPHIGFASPRFFPQIAKWQHAKIPSVVFLLLCVVGFTYVGTQLKFDFDLSKLGYENKPLLEDHEFFAKNFEGHKQQILLSAHNATELIALAGALQKKIIEAYMQHGQGMQDSQPTTIPLSLLHNTESNKAFLNSLIMHQNIQTFQALLPKIESSVLANLKSEEQKNAMAQVFTTMHSAYDERHFENPTLTPKDLDSMGFSVREYNGRLYYLAMIEQSDMPIVLDFAKALQEGGVNGDSWQIEPRALQSILDNLTDTIYTPMLIVLGLALCAMLITLALSARKAFLECAAFVLFPLCVALCVITSHSALNIMHLFALLILVVVSVDYGIYSAKEGMNLRTSHAIFFSAITTGVSFGILMISDTKALNSFGEVIFSGMGCILLLLFLAKIQRKI